jgi:ribosomal protein L7Ae-like RNA K-turn-binding protein
LNKEKAIQTIGLAFKANKVLHGETLVLEAIRSKKAKLVLLASDTGPNTTKRITDKAAFYQIPLYTGFITDDLSRAIGKDNRKVLAILNQDFRKLIENALTE